MAAYNVPDYAAAARFVPRIARFSFCFHPRRRRADRGRDRLSKIFRALASGVPVVFHLPELRVVYSRGRIFQNRARLNQLARLQFHFLPRPVHQLALGSHARAAFRLVGLQTGRDDGSRDRRVVAFAGRGALRLARRHLHDRDRLRRDQDLQSFGLAFGAPHRVVPGVASTQRPTRFLSAAWPLEASARSKSVGSVFGAMNCFASSMKQPRR